SRDPRRARRCPRVRESRPGAGAQPQAMTFLDHDWYPRPVPENVVIGPRSWVHSAFAFLHFRATGERALRIGADTGVYIGTMFDLGPNAEVVIGDFCTLAAPILSTDRKIVVGDY